ncbi:hypothetical protein Hanom_Chr17g01552221 [Helianthus anomalus]
MKSSPFLHFALRGSVLDLVNFLLRGDSGLCLTNMLVEEAQRLILQSHVRSASVI